MSYRSVERYEEPLRLEKVLGNVGNGNKTERTRNLKDLKAIFDKTNRAENLSSLTDKSYHHIFEILWKIILDEKAALTGKRSTIAQNRLEAAADAFRLAIKAGASKLKPRTLEAVIDHITETLPSADGEYFPGLGQIYLKALACVLEHKPNVENLKPSTWTEVTAFCLNGINIYLDAHEAEPLDLTRSFSGLGTSVPTSSVRSTPGNGGSQNTASSISKQNIEDLFSTLLSLVSAPSPPLLKGSQLIVDSIIRFLRLHASSVGLNHQLAFSILNAVLSFCREDRSALLQAVALETLPIIPRFWQGKITAHDHMLNSVRDETIILLFTCQLHIERSIQEKTTADIAVKLVAILDLLRYDYARRSDRLQLEHVGVHDFGHNTTELTPFRLHSFHLQFHDPRSERNWASLQTIALLERLVYLAEKNEKPVSSKDDDGRKHPAKRRKTLQVPDRLLDPLRSNDVNVKLVGLQVIPFILQQSQLSRDRLGELLQALTDISWEKSDSIASWNLLAMASCTHQTAASSYPGWIDLWHNCIKALTFSDTCRAAALLLHSIAAAGFVQYQEIGEDISTIIIAADISGPIILCDSAAHLMVHCLEARISEAPGASAESCQSVVRWLFAHWNPGEKLLAAQAAQPRHIIDVLRVCLGLTKSLPPADTSTLRCGLVAQAWQQHLATQSVVRYLLLLDELPLEQDTTLRGCISCSKNTEIEEGASVVIGSHVQATRRLVLELLGPKVDAIHATWTQQSPFIISTDSVRRTVHACIAILLLMSLFGESSIPQVVSVETKIEKVIDEFMKTLFESQSNDPKGTSAVIEALLSAVYPYLPTCDTAAFSRMIKNTPKLHKFFTSIAKFLAYLPEAEDGMDLDGEEEDFPTQKSQLGLEDTSLIPRRYHSLYMSSASFFVNTKERLLLLASIGTEGIPTGTFPSTFVKHILELSDEELLSCSKLLNEMLRSDITLTNDDAVSLIKHSGRFLTSNDWNKCEVSQKFCLDVLTGLSQHWIPEDATELSSLANDVFHWFISVALKTDIVSPEIEKSMSQLLIHLSTAEVPEDRGSPSSPRTYLFTMLSKSNASVKFHIGNQIPAFFGNYLLTDHDKTFVDILACLPADPEWIEGIALRLFVLAKIGSKWPHLLRRCIYHIFEVPPRVLDSVPYATRCLSTISSALKVNGSRELFALFAPQLLYTWLLRDKLEDIPFQIFGFQTLEELLYDTQHIAAGLMIMRVQEKEFENLASLLDTTPEMLMKRCFTNIMAYSIAHTISNKPKKASRDPTHGNGEALTRNRLGKDYLECLNTNLADIIAILFNTIDHEDPNKPLLFQNELAYAGEIMSEIKRLNDWSIELPPNQQPTFKPRYLTDWISHVCSRTKHEPKTLYTPVLVTFVSRSLLDTIHPALGSLHVCSVLRKLRVLVSLAGSTAVQGYPLEMLLQSISEYIADADCTNDASGLVQYLLTNGTEHLSKSPTFVAGITLSILGHLRNFLTLRQASTTQESQFQATRSRAHKFHKWMSEFVSKYASSELDEKTQAKLTSLMQTACNIGLVGNADLGSSESKLLMQLLEDEKTNKSLLSPPSRESALTMLCSEFQAPKSFREDIFGNDQLAIKYAAVIWKSCTGPSASKEYLSWAGRVLGRAFAASGHLHKEPLQESSLSQLHKLVPSLHTEGDTSRAYVLSLLQSLMLGSNQRTVGLAEASLRAIVTYTFDKRDNELKEMFERNFPKHLQEASYWDPYIVPASEILSIENFDTIAGNPFEADAIMRKSWLCDLAIVTARMDPKDRILSALVPILQGVPGFADRAFPFVIHLVLSAPNPKVQQLAKETLSKSFSEWFGDCENVDQSKLKMLLDSILFLRTQKYPGEKSIADRSRWLTIDYKKASIAAIRCGMYKTALLLVEEFCSGSASVKSSRRSSAIVKDSIEVPNDILLEIFSNIDDPDSYYGVQQDSSLAAILSRLEYEKDGSKSLAFRGAQYDSHVRQRDHQSADDVESLVKALDVLNLSGLSHSLLQAQKTVGMSDASLDSMFRTARKLEQWDIPVPNTYGNNSLTIYKAFQAIQNASSSDSCIRMVNDGFDCVMTNIIQNDLSARALNDTLQTLAILVELDEVISTRTSMEFENMIDRFNNRSGWMKTGRFEDINQILSCRGTSLSILSQNSRLQTITGLVPLDARLMEVQTALLASKLNRSHNALQGSLSLATSLMDLIPPCKELGLNFEVAIHMEAAHALWDQGEVASSIGMLKALDSESLLKKQTVVVGRSDLLSKIGAQVSSARLENPDRILESYLMPALKELKGEDKGTEAGEVFHQFALFCDQQLQDPDSIEDLDRLQMLSNNKRDEVAYLANMLKSATSKEERYKIAHSLKKNQEWLKLDDLELERHIKSRSDFLRQCLENYLLSLKASNEHDKNALRFTALWLEHSDEMMANDAVRKLLHKVPSYKLAPLMNQLSSRLQDNVEEFQKLLFSLVLRICVDHPYAGMYQIYAIKSSRPNEQDDTAISRQSAANNIASQLLNDPRASPTWYNINTTNRAYCAFAAEKSSAGTEATKYESGQKIHLNKSRYGNQLQTIISKRAIPPPTMHIPLIPSLDYSKLPVMKYLHPMMSIASGVSRPKTITAVASDGKEYKQLVKGSDDDLRQDAIMEQVFEQVSELLKTNRSTRQRDLSIRTYKVLPLTSTAGVIEWVLNTIPLHEYLIPAHKRYHPGDKDASSCRKEITAAQKTAKSHRLQVYRDVCARFNPVMRYFFIERFSDPDEWFVKRLAYTRTTAAASILGHVLGLGDRHGHNILLDNVSGEVVHIDLGVAFEMGRILPVPEMVPFRLTRDIIDGMGITKTEGVFRRCCEFTLEALRKESNSIIAILDVLRYDPLYSWSISPLRLAKLQEGKDEPTGTDMVAAPEKSKQEVNEPGEADRALTVVAKKLSKTLSVTATVNDLINQATDEMNLATLYSGWAAYV